MLQYNRIDPVSLESLQICLETYEKCLTFDFVAVLLNETLEEPSSTTLPTAWAKEVEQPSTLSKLFETVQVTL